jgi:hypothetical protein
LGVQGKSSIQGQMLFEQKKELINLLNGKKAAASAKYKTQRDIASCCAAIREYIEEATFRNLKYSDLDSSSAFCKKLSSLGVFKLLKTDNLIHRAISAFLNQVDQDKENLTPARLQDLKDLEELLKNIKLLKPAEEKKEAPKSKTLEEKKEDPRPKTKKVEKIAPTEEKKEKEEKKEEAAAIFGAADQAGLLPTIFTHQVQDWIAGALRCDIAASNLLSAVIDDLQRGRDREEHLAKTRYYQDKAYIVHITKKQRLYFVYEIVDGKRTLVFLYGGPKKDQKHDLECTHAWYMRFKNEMKKKK